jgi:glycosyl transferase family 92
MKDRLRRLLPPRMWAGGRTALNWFRRIGYRRARLPKPIGTRPPIRLAICAIFKDEARYLAEWVTFHRIQGVEHFYLYDNRSADDWRSALGPEIEAGIVEVQDWPQIYPQQGAYNDCLNRHRKQARWIAFIDIDEFLFSPTGKPLPEVLREFEMYPGVVVNWRMFGTNGWKHPPEGLVTENFLMRAPNPYPDHQFVKSIVNPRAAINNAGPHYFQLRGHPVGEDRVPVQSPFRTPTADLLRINHYYSKSEEDFRRKTSRPMANIGMVKIEQRMAIPPDVVRDETILQFDSQLRALLSSRTAGRVPAT